MYVPTPRHSTITSPSRQLKIFVRLPSPYALPLPTLTAPFRQTSPSSFPSAGICPPTRASCNPEPWVRDRSTAHTYRSACVTNLYTQIDSLSEGAHARRLVRFGKDDRGRGIVAGMQKLICEWRWAEEGWGIQGCCASIASLFVRGAKSLSGCDRLFYPERRCGRRERVCVCLSLCNSELASREKIASAVGCVRS